MVAAREVEHWTKVQHHRFRCPAGSYMDEITPYIVVFGVLGKSDRARCWSREGDTHPTISAVFWMRGEGLEETQSPHCFRCFGKKDR